MFSNYGHGTKNESQFQSYGLNESEEFPSSSSSSSNVAMFNEGGGATDSDAEIFAARGGLYAGS